VALLREQLTGQSVYDGIASILIGHIGPQFILVAITLGFSSGRARRHAIDRLETRLRRSHPRIRRVFVRVRKSDHLED
jgi:hypothetical protein